MVTEGTGGKDPDGGMGEDTMEVELDRVVGMLRHADPDEVDVWATPPFDLEDRIVERIRAERDGRVVDLGERRSGDPADRRDRSAGGGRGARRTGMPRLLVAAAAAVVAVILAVGAFSLIRGDGRPGSDADAIELAGAAPGITGSVSIVEGDDATELRLTASGLEPNAVYAAWLAPAEGEKVPAGTVRADENGEVDAELVSSFPVSEAARVWVTDPAATTVLNAPLG